MKKLFTLAAATLLSLGAGAQITINQADYAGWTPRTDTFQDIDPQGFNIALSAGASWNLTTATYDPDAFTYTYDPFTNAAIPGATYSYMSGYGFSALAYIVDIAGGVMASGIEELGESVPASKIDISGLTGNAGDELNFPAQMIRYSAPRLRLVFPATSTSVWGSSFNRSTNFGITYHKNNYTGARKTYTTQKDSVKGWGRVRIKRLDGTNSGWMDVLAVKTQVKTVDSFSLNGQPQFVLDALLSGFRLSQGMRDSTHTVSLFRKGEVEPLVMFSYTDTTYSTADYVTVHQSRIPVATSVNEFPGAAAIKLYPNPATSASGFNVDLIETAPGTWSYNLIDASGKVVSSANLNPAGGKAHISTPVAALGTYFLNLQKDGQQVATKAVTIGN